MIGEGYGGCSSIYYAASRDYLEGMSYFQSTLRGISEDFQSGTRTTTGKLCVYLGSILFWTTVHQYLNREHRRQIRGASTSKQQIAHDGAYYLSPSPSPTSRERSLARAQQRPCSPRERIKALAHTDAELMLKPVSKALISDADAFAAEEEDQLEVMVVGIAGGSGSGKTTLATAIFEALGRRNCSYIMHDSYYKDFTHLTPEQRDKVNFGRWWVWWSCTSALGSGVGRLG